MSTRQKRTILKGKDAIKKIIEDNGMRYTFIHNGLFDELFTKESIKGLVPVRINDPDNPGKTITTWEMGETKITELEVVVYIFLQFMMINKFTLNYKEFADYIGCSSKQIKVALNRLESFEGTTNGKYSSAEDRITIVDERSVNLITPKMHSAYLPTIKGSIHSRHWYTNYIPNYKKSKDDKLLPVQFFMVSIDDFELLTEGVLSRTEFLTYLFLLKSYKYGTKDEGQMWWRLSTIAETLNYKLVKTVHTHIEKLLNTKKDGVPLLEEIRPNNYELQILKGEEPASRYLPRYNTAKMKEMNFGKQEMSFEKEEMSLDKQEMDYAETEVDLPKQEMKYPKQEMDDEEWEMPF
ncbi:hypothetical protein ACIQXQ_20045 [Peribacillus sp. NPDC097198]|uniref:hypothetical protein n=1 Tax=Peribacillus sp. NPDC097198 TaxID=3364397 RepID=UPI003819E90D